jgi:hypothetical protein
VSAATQADFEDMNTGGGAVKRITGGADSGMIYQERAISRMTYAGPPTIFDIDKDIYEGLGTPSGLSVVEANGIDYLWSTIGFISIDGAGQITPIGSQKVDRHFADQLTSGDEENIIGAHDPANNAIVWLYGASSSADTQTAIAYNYKVNQWYEMSFTQVNTQETNFRDAQFVFPAKLGTQTEQILYVATGDSSTPNYGAWALADDTDSMFGTITTREYQFTENARSMFGRAQVMTSYTGSLSRQMKCIHRPDQTSSATTTTSMALASRSDEFHVRVEDRYHRIQSILSGKFRLSGIDIREAQPSSRI